MNNFINKIKKHKIVRKLGRTVKDKLSPYFSSDQQSYHVKKYYPTIVSYREQLEQEKGFHYRPQISILLPVYNTSERFLRECVESVLVQSYSNWELCISDDHSPDKRVVEVIKEYQAKDPRIQLIERKENSHISEATNSALSIASGEFVALLDHDDVLWANALFEVVKALNEDEEIDLIYTDEDKIDESSLTHSFPFFKPQWSPEFLESCNFITHFSVIRKELMQEIGGERTLTNGAQDWDLFVRISEKTEKIRHIPKILYSWRVHSNSTAKDGDSKPYIYNAQKLLLEAHIQRQGKTGIVKEGIVFQHRVIEYDVKPDSKLSVYVKGVCQSTIDLLKKTQDSSLLTEYVFDKKEITGTSVVVVNGNFERITKHWNRLLLADTQIDRVSFVYPLIEDKAGKLVRSAGVGIGVGKNGYVDLFQGVSLSENQFLRKIYLKNRRNVTAGNSFFYAMSRETFDASLLDCGFDAFLLKNMDEIKKGNRSIYTPYVQIRTSEKLPETVFREGLGYEDAYLNPNFSREFLTGSK